MWNNYLRYITYFPFEVITHLVRDYVSQNRSMKSQLRFHVFKTFKTALR